MKYLWNMITLYAISLKKGLAEGVLMECDHIVCH